MELIPVSREAHGKMCLKPIVSYAFAKNLPLLRVLASEAPLIALSHPIVFVKENDVVMPFAILGLRKDENLFISEDGRWLGLYIPAMLRRYPFFTTKAVGMGVDDVTLMVDKAGLSETEGEPLFGPEDSEPKGPVARAIQLYAEIAMDGARTATLTNILVTNGLLDPLPLQIISGTESPVNLSGMQTVNESKLNALPDDRYLDIRRSGALALAYAQFFSLGQFGRIQALSSAKPQQPPTPVS